MDTPPPRTPPGEPDLPLEQTDKPLLGPAPDAPESPERQNDPPAQAEPDAVPERASEGEPESVEPAEGGDEPPHFMD